MWKSGAVYHNICSVNFRTGKKIPQYFTVNDNNVEKRATANEWWKGSMQADAFMKTMAYFETKDEEQVTVHDLKKICKKTVYKRFWLWSVHFHVLYMKYQLQKHFGNMIIIIEINGVRNIVTFRRTASSLLRSFYEQLKEDDSEVKKLSDSHNCKTYHQLNMPWAFCLNHWSTF